MQVNNDFPIVTVVIPCHNHAKWIRRAILSVVNQQYPVGNLRLAVVDDGSTDDSLLEIARSMAVGCDFTKSDGAREIRQIGGSINGIPIIVVSTKDARGPSWARNLGMMIGSDGTDIFGLLDSDDEYHPRKVMASVDKFVKSPRIGAVYSDYSTLNEETGLRIREYKEPFSRDRLMRECIVNCDSMVLKDAVLAVGDFDEEMRVCEDYDFWVRLSEKYVISHIPEDLVTIRVGDHSSSANVHKDIWHHNYQRVFQKAHYRRLHNV